MLTHMYYINNKTGQKYQNKYIASRDDRNLQDTDFYCMDKELIEVQNKYVHGNAKLPATKRLIHTRILQLRDKYKKLRLWYSGGADSQTALNAFIEHGVKLDYVANIRARPDDDFEHYSEAEANHRARVFLKEHGIELTDVSLGSEEHYKLYSECKDPHLFLNNSHFRPVYLPAMQYTNPHLFKEEGVGEIWCDLKPNIFFRDGAFYTTVWDYELSHNIGFPNLENFFTSPDLPELHLGQCMDVKIAAENTYTKQALEASPEMHDRNPIYRDFIEYYSRDRYERIVDLGKARAVGGVKNTSCIIGAKQGNKKVYDGYKEKIMREMDFFQLYGHLHNMHGVIIELGEYNGLES